jgi:hypothetical protein
MILLWSVFIFFVMLITVWVLFIFRSGDDTAWGDGEDVTWLDGCAEKEIKDIRKKGDV